MQERKYEISPVPFSLSLGVPAHCIDFIKGDGAITPLEVGVDESEARVLGDAWVAGHDVVRQIMDGVPIKTILADLGSSGDRE